MRAALETATAALHEGELPIGAVVVAEGRIIARSSTRERALGRWLVHAELLALLQADEIAPFPGRRRAARLYTTLEPCMMCLGACLSFPVGAVHYALESPGDGAVALLDTWKRKQADMPGYGDIVVAGGCCAKRASRCSASTACCTRRAACTTGR